MTKTFGKHKFQPLFSYSVMLMGSVWGILLDLAVFAVSLQHQRQKSRCWDRNRDKG